MYKTLMKIYLPHRVFLTTVFILFEALFVSLTPLGQLHTVLVITIASIVVEYRLVHPYLMSAKNLEVHKQRVSFGFSLGRPMIIFGILLVILNWANPQDPIGHIGHSMLAIGLIISNAYIFGNLRILKHREEGNILLTE